MIPPEIACKRGIGGRYAKTVRLGGTINREDSQKDESTCGDDVMPDFYIEKFLAFGARCAYQPRSDAIATGTHWTKLSVRLGRLS